MDRIIYDVPRWSIYLHRDARGLPPVEHDDPALRRFEDELFEKLYSGGVETLDDERRDKQLAEWAANIHAACDQLPDFARLTADCRGEAFAAATAVEKLMNELHPKMQQQQDAPALRRMMRSACGKAAAAVDEARDIADGLEQVAFGSMPGCGHVVGDSCPSSMARSLALRIRDDARLRRIALLAGRFKRIAAAKQRQKTRHGSDEVSDIELGANVGRLLPSELVRLRHPRLHLTFLRDLVEKRAMQYALRGSVALGKGPLVVALDKSGSMDGQPDIWATAVALALLDVAQREHRPFAMLSFDEGIKYEALVPVGGALPEQALFVACGGGTDIANVIDRGLTIIGQNPGAMRKADIVLITDGGSNPERAPELRARAAALGVTILGFGIGVDPAALAPWTDEAQGVVDLDRLDERSADTLFSR